MKILFSLLTALAMGWGAAQSCDRTRTEFDDLYCTVQLFVQADKELNDAYRELVAKLNPEGQRILREAQRRWIAGRDRESAAKLEGQTVFYMGTATRMTQERTLFLKARIRECNSTGCVNAKLR